MPDSPHTRLRHPNRLRQPHSGETLEPPMTRKGAFGHPGSLILGFFGLVFIAYAFNYGGTQGYLDGFFGGLDTRVKSHNDGVASFVVAVLPYLGVAVGMLVLYLLASSLGRSLRSLGRKNKPKARPIQQAETQQPVRPAQEFIRPARLAVREADMPFRTAASSPEEVPAGK